MTEAERIRRARMLEARKGLRHPTPKQVASREAGKRGKERAREALGGAGWETVSRG